MTADEARLVAWIASRADGGCSTCAGALGEMLSAAFQEHDWRTLISEAPDHAEVFRACGFVEKPRGSYTAFFHPVTGEIV